jgi:hypothetical protein
MIRQGTAPGGSLLCAARLIGLEKPDGGIRPIAIGDLIYRVATKAILTTLEKISQVFEGSTLSLNLNKSKEYSIKTLRKTGLLALGTAIGPILLRRAFLQQRLETLGGILSTLKEMPKQYAYLLLKGSISLLIRHLLRQLSPIGLEDLWAKADDLIRALVGHLTQRSPSDLIPTLNDDLVSLPLREGGLGLTLYTDYDGNLLYTTYTAAYYAAKPLMEAIGSTRAPRTRQSSPNATTPTAKQALKDAVQIRIQRFQAT